MDYHGGLGAVILGYAHPIVDAAATRAIRETGALLGLPHQGELELAERLCSLVPYAEMAALCGGGGSDAIYHAIRLARAATGRSMIVRVEGGYHGWHSDIAVSSKPVPPQRTASGLPRLVPDSSGSLAAVTDKVIVVSVNDQQQLGSVFDTLGAEIAAFIVEPVVFSAGCIVVDPAYLRLARELCSRHSAVLVFDELLTGFRTAIGGASGFSGVEPDLGAFGKAMANGYPMSALLGRADLMRLLSPVGDVYYAGTFNGHPASVAAAMATIDVLESDGVPQRVAGLGDRLSTAVNAAIGELDVNAVCQSFGSIWTVYLGTKAVNRYDDIRLDGHWARLYEELHLFLIQQGIFMQRRYVPRCAVSALHGEADIDWTAGILIDFLRQHAARLYSA
jgi:glutamate-1-semialdehyde 2,1-aminomutase